MPVAAPLPTPTPGCARCAAEGRGARARAVSDAAAVLAMVASAVTCGLWFFMQRPHVAGVPALDRVERIAPWSIGLSLACAAVALALRAAAAILAARAARPLPRPSPDARAHYRVAPPAECARHPFAR
jgi:hypothetical protein